MTDFKFEGTVIHGTLRPEDLIPRFEQVMHELDPDWLAYEKEKPNLTNEDEMYYLSDMIYRLNELAPEGYYFGFHPGDGSDYGFWKIEDSEA